MQVQDIGFTPAQFGKQVWGLLGDLSKMTTVDQTLLQMRKYSGTLGASQVSIHTAHKDLRLGFIYTMIFLYHIENYLMKYHYYP